MLVNGINEFSGYAAVAIAGVVTAYIVNLIGARQGLFIFGIVVMTLGLLSSIFYVKETTYHALSCIKETILQ
ncbi:hypothetical protein [Candidatus Ruthturnera calyptogenae]|uniref:hypothetical protein n=1 Tax=Candidatus Ruthturnera calyptogenae TaxID=386487 RepID=UPI0002E04E86|nr:hypothetical protein [Candidatus Ruthturnera calyptogenae]